VNELTAPLAPPAGQEPAHGAGGMPSGPEAPPPIISEKTLHPAQWGMICFLASEGAFFCTLITAYLTFLGSVAADVDPKPVDTLKLSVLVIVSTLCLLSSSGTIHKAEGALRQGTQKGFCLWWGLTVLLGVIFLGGTAIEWRELIVEKHLTISRNLFGTSYYTLVGFHALHVTGGVIAMAVVLGLGLRNEVTAKNHLGAEMVAWYWHFVDGVWVVVFTVVYLVGR
jgi:cytochrome c oxidase subunit 3/cytochrome o ubiquinol oxidase subunit 3